MMMRGFVLALCVSALIAGSVQGAVRSFRADFDGLQEDPPNASPGTGFLEATLDDVTGFVTVTAGSYSGLLSNSTNAHIHGPAGYGTSAGVVLQLTGPFGSTSGSLGGSGTLSRIGFTTQDLIDAMIQGNTYVNVHSQTHPGGEIRGQLIEVPEPTVAMGLLTLSAAVILRRRK